MSRDERVARNEAVSREINEAIEAATPPTASDQHLRMVCECGLENCDRVIAITLAEYEQVRQDARTFAVVNEHVLADVEVVVGGTERFTVVQKREGAPAEVAESTDPR
jgi:hypothetical protein